MHAANDKRLTGIAGATGCGARLGHDVGAGRAWHALDSLVALVAFDALDALYSLDALKTLRAPKPRGAGVSLGDEFLPVERVRARQFGVVVALRPPHRAELRHDVI